MKKFILILSLVLSGCGGGSSNTPVLETVITPVSKCALKTYVSTAPPEYNGKYSIPNPSSKLDPSIIRGMSVKDYYPADQSDNCAQYEYTRLLYKKTLDRLQSIGIDYVEINQYGPVTDFNNSTWVVEQPARQIPESELIWFIKEANSRNIKVNLIWQLWGVDTKGNNINTSSNTSEEYMLKVLRGWHDIIIDVAKFGGANGLNILTIQWNAFYFPVVLKYPTSATQEFLYIVDDIRKYYNGKLYMSASPMFFDKRLVDKVDAIIVPLMPSNWSYYDDNNLSVPLLKERYKDAIIGNALQLSIATGMSAKSIPIIWDLSIQSRDKALSDGWVEDGFCITPTSNGGAVNYNDPLCIQKNYVTDFSIQANAYEAAFQAIKEQTQAKTYGVNVTGYWHTDTVAPGTEGFPNLSASIRGKPAENIVKYWYSKI